MAKKKKNARPSTDTVKRSGVLRIGKYKWFGLILSAVLLGVFQVFPSLARYPAYWYYEAEDAITSLFVTYDNLELGEPEGQMVDRVINRRGYALGYSEKHEQALWVTYKLTRDEVADRTADRSDDFRSDPRILTGSATPEDYKASGFDRGHLAPAADMAWSKRVMSESFYMSNMSPQRPEFNRGIWKDLESEVRRIAKDESEIFVVTGPFFEEQVKAVLLQDSAPAERLLFKDSASASIGASRVTVPAGYYKVLYDLTPPQKMIGFLLFNEASSKKLVSFACPVTGVERLTGLRFFPGLSSPDVARLKTECDPSAWKL